MRSPRHPKPEQCHICGCTYWRPCEEGCAWVTADHTLCTRCLERIVDFATLTILAPRLAGTEQAALLKEIAR